MSKSEFDNDGFRVVASKRSSKNKQTRIPRKGYQIQEGETEIDVEKSILKIQAAVDDLQGSAYLESVSKSVSTILYSQTVVEIVCFGLGHIGECNISRYQLALLLNLKELLNPNKVLVHDPVFYKPECSILQKLGLEVIKENTEGSYVISDNGVTLLFFPHCPKQLTNNFLWCNWGSQLQNCVLICNSFNSLFVNQPERIISGTVPFIYKIHPLTTEVALDNIFKFTDIFNDTSIHTFPKEKIEKLDVDFWSKAKKPEYKDSEEFITSLIIEKLSI